MIQVLCLDTEPETVQAMREAGHFVATGELGFRTGRPLLTDPPHEFDLMVCDLRRPACFDATRWGPGLNSNFSCRIEPLLEDISFSGADGRTRPKFELIRETQMPPRPVGTFGPTDVFTAVNTGGTPLILFLNPDWLRHVPYTNPNITNVRWGFERTKALKLVNTSVMDLLVAGLADSAALAVPLEFAIAESAHRPETRIPNAFTTIPLVTNTVAQVFGEVVVLENGIILAMPPFRDNARFCVKLLERSDSFRAAQSSLLAPGRNTTSKFAKATIVDRPVRDVFISHASEDKAEIARPLAETLIEKGLSVWFDEYELTLGDRLRRKIEEGLRVSRFGVTILSENFFRKKWPQEELDALFALETISKKILPVWHRLSETDIALYAPLLAGRLAVSTDIGIPGVVEAILKAVKQ